MSDDSKLLDSEIDEFAVTAGARKDHAWAMQHLKAPEFDVATAHDRRREVEALVSDYMARGGEVIRVGASESNPNAALPVAMIRFKERYKKLWIKILAATAKRYPGGFDLRDIKTVARQLGYERSESITINSICGVCHADDPFQFIEIGGRILFSARGVLIDADSVIARIEHERQRTFGFRKKPKPLRRPDAMSGDAARVAFDAAVMGMPANAIVKKLNAHGFAMRSGAAVTLADVEDFKLREELEIQIERSRRFGPRLSGAPSEAQGEGQIPNGGQRLSQTSATSNLRVCQFLIGRS